MICKRLDWDSDFFNKEITEVDFLTYKKNIFSDIEKYDLIYFKNCSIENYIIPKFELTYQENKVVFSKKLFKNEVQFNSIVYDADFSTIKNELFYSLAFESGKHSRFKLDSKFQIEKFRELYIKWVDNSINKQFADKVFYIKRDQEVVGFITVKKHENHAVIGLVAVNPNSQGKGYGSMLIQNVEKYCIENEIFELQIPTQKENLNACQFYTKLGYLQVNEINIKHYWRL